MRFNELQPASGSKPLRKRVGRGRAAGGGKTAGRGHKGLKSRSGGRVARGFEGGQMPLHRRLPKFGFTSRTAQYKGEIKVSDLAAVKGDEISVQALKEAGLIRRRIKQVKVIAGGEIDRAVTLLDVRATAGARKVIEAANGKVPA